MSLSEIKKLLISSLNEDSEPGNVARMLEKKGISYDFSDGFTNRVLSRVFSANNIAARQIEFTRYLNLAFSRIALTGIAAIILLLISIFLVEGDLSFNSILGVSDSQAESIVCLITGY